MIVERRDGSLWMLIRDQGGIAESVSRDHGVTWSASLPSTIPHGVSRFFIRRLRSGHLLLMKHNSPNVDAAWMQGKTIAKPKQARSHLAAFLSSDDGKTWTGGLMIDERSGVSYPDADQADDGRIFLIYDRDRTGAREILLATFTEADISDGKLSDPRSALRLIVSRVGDPTP
jgi:hypothetical protein